MSRTKVMLSIPAEFLAELDKAAQEENRSRSEFIREAARFYIRVRKARSIPGQNPLIQEAIAIQDMLAEQDDSKDWDSTAEIRKWRGEI